jgi:hypothetical protein
MTKFTCVLFTYFYFLSGFIGLNQFINVVSQVRCFGSIGNACMNGLIKRRNAYARRRPLSSICSGLSRQIMGLKAQKVQSGAFYKVI